MSDQNPVGEQREARRIRLQKIVIGLAMALGAATALTLAFASPEAPLTGDAAWPPLVALMIAVSTLVVLPVLMLVAMRTTDEMELAWQAWAMQAGGFALLCAYPAWYALWKGGFVPEPHHLVIYLGYFIVTMIAYAWRRTR